MAFHGRKWGFGDGDSSEPMFHSFHVPTNPENQNSNFKKPRWATDTSIIFKNSQMTPRRYILNTLTESKEF